MGVLPVYKQNQLFEKYAISRGTTLKYKQNSKMTVTDSYCS